jgi:hypothetical protein
MPRALDRSLGSEADIDRNNQNMIAIVSVQPKGVLG